ncbi:hypothetical protein SDC9_104000 [bioreactor metagenome]|uniref:Uncharacterized protein n=1 Tax=bioreactor metagenome TaxID=1076179 RepID=A0A645AWM5_9ZZZZ
MKHFENQSATHPAQNDGCKQQRIQQNKREVNLVDPAEQMDHESTTGCGLQFLSAEQDERQQNPQTRSGIGLDQEQNRGPRIPCLFNPQRRKDAMVERIVQEQYLQRFYKKIREQQQIPLDQPAYKKSNLIRDARNDRADKYKAQIAEQHA